MIISVDEEKAFGNNSTSIRDRSTQQTRNRRDFLNFLKNTYEKPTANSCT